MKKQKQVTVNCLLQKQWFFISVCLIAFAFSAKAQTLSFPTAKIKFGDDLSWKEKSIDDSDWQEIKTDICWEDQVGRYDGYAWYRIRFRLPSSLLENSYWKKNLCFFLSKIDDLDETYLNGKCIGKTGTFPSKQGESVESKYNVIRNYFVPVNDPAVLWNEENVLAVRIYDRSGAGGIFGEIPTVQVVDLIDDLSIEWEPAKGAKIAVILKNNATEKQKGKWQIQVETAQNGTVIKTISQKGEIKPGDKVKKEVGYPEGERIKISVSYTDAYSGKTINKTFIPPYILTPQAPETPRINGAKVFGARPGSPILFKIAASGEKPLRYEVENLPQGLALDEATGIITGQIDKEGDYSMTFIVSNKKGKTERAFTVRVGELLALTPPMGWNSWNCWGPSVTEAKVQSSARALIDKGLIDYGWTYINIDDCWQASERANDGTITGNDRFPNLKVLGDWLHDNGLKFGIYSSPGERTCAGYLGSYNYEAIDAKRYAEWGVDYLKYDWCSYGDVFREENDESIYAYIKPYKVMEKQLRAQKRDIIYSLCQYGMKDVWEWGPAVDGNCWRTTGDIEDTWNSLKNIGFHQNDLYPFARPGRWNDPDMLIVGMVGWGDHLHPTRLTADEQYTHISLWCLLASPLLIGCDIAQMDDFTLGLLTNSEVLDVNQDPLGKQAKQILAEENIQVWAKSLEDGSKAVGIFNLNEEDVTYTIDIQRLGANNVLKVRDLWKQCDIAVSGKSLQVKIPAHGVILLKV
jgi:hypothetical protein